MPRRRKHSTLTIRDIENLRKISPSTWIILLGFLVGFLLLCVGIDFITSFTSWLNNNLGLAKSFTSNVSWFLIVALVILSLSLPFVFLVVYQNNIWKKYKSIRIANIDTMNGIEFEHYLQRLLANQGYNVHVTQASGDLGVDLIASKNGEKIAIQAKRYNTKVSRRAISDAVAGIFHYGCDKAMVITNNYFSPGAVTLARSTGCILIDRDILARWVTEFQSSS